MSPFLYLFGVFMLDRNEALEGTGDLTRPICADGDVQGESLAPPSIVSALGESDMSRFVTSVGPSEEEEEEEFFRSTLTLLLLLLLLPEPLPLPFEVVPLLLWLLVVVLLFKLFPMNKCEEAELGLSGAKVILGTICPLARRVPLGPLLPLRHEMSKGSSCSSFSSDVSSTV